MYQSSQQVLDPNMNVAVTLNKIISRYYANIKQKSLKYIHELDVTINKLVMTSNQDDFMKTADIFIELLAGILKMMRMKDHEISHIFSSLQQLLFGTYSIDKGYNFVVMANDIVKKYFRQTNDNVFMAQAAPLSPPFNPPFYQPPSNPPPPSSSSSSSDSSSDTFIDKSKKNKISSVAYVVGAIPQSTSGLSYQKIKLTYKGKGYLIVIIRYRKELKAIELYTKGKKDLIVKFEPLDKEYYPRMKLYVHALDPTLKLVFINGILKYIQKYFGHLPVKEIRVTVLDGKKEIIEDIGINEYVDDLNKEATKN